MAESCFKLQHSLEWRKAESSRIRKAYPNKIPVVMGRSDIADINNNNQKYLVDADMTVGSFVYQIRKKIDSSMKMNLLIFVKNVLQPSAAMMLAVFEEHKDEDGFLYVTFGLSNEVDDDVKQDLRLITRMTQSGIITFIIRNMNKTDPRSKKHVQIGYLIKKFRTSNWERRRCALALKGLNLMDSSNAVSASVRLKLKNLFSLKKHSL